MSKKNANMHENEMPCLKKGLLTVFVSDPLQNCCAWLEFLAHSDHVPSHYFASTKYIIEYI